MVHQVVQIVWIEKEQAISQYGMAPLLATLLTSQEVVGALVGVNIVHPMGPMPTNTLGSNTTMSSSFAAAFSLNRFMTPSLDNYFYTATQERFTCRVVLTNSKYVPTSFIYQEPSEDGLVDPQRLDSIVDWAIQDVSLTLKDIRRWGHITLDQGNKMWQDGSLIRHTF